MAVFSRTNLGMAISLTKKLDKPQDYEKRFFLYVAPGPKSSGVNKDFSASQAVYVNTALRGAISQARFRTGLTSAKPINQLKSLTTTWF